jgi:hypothetical protein
MLIKLSKQDVHSSELMGKGYESDTATVDYETGIMLMREMLAFK